MVLYMVFNGEYQCLRVLYTVFNGETNNLFINGG